MSLWQFFLGWFALSAVLSPLIGRFLRWRFMDQERVTISDC